MPGYPGQSGPCSASRGAKPLQQGDVLRIELSGAGGYGDPRQRAPLAGQRDGRAGLVSVAAAASVYGVRLAPHSFAIDHKATAVLRAGQAKEIA